MRGLSTFTRLFYTTDSLKELVDSFTQAFFDPHTKQLWISDDALHMLDQIHYVNRNCCPISPDCLHPIEEALDKKGYKVLRRRGWMRRSDNVLWAWLIRKH